MGGRSPKAKSAGRMSSACWGHGTQDQEESPPAGLASGVRRQRVHVVECGVSTLSAHLGPWGSACSPSPPPHPDWPKSPPKAPKLEWGPSQPQPQPAAISRPHQQPV